MTITPSDWARIRVLFQGALERPPTERALFLRERTAGDEAIRREVESLLAAHIEAPSFLERPAPGTRRNDAARHATMRLAPGSRLGVFEILEPLGCGGMGEVYKATDTRLGRLVALKVLSAETAADPDARQRFEREARGISRLNHPHICTLHDVGSVPLEGLDVPFLVMELLEGETLAARLGRGPLPVGQAVMLGIEIADALAAAHTRGVVHRDLKPANIMLTSAGVKLLDFGLARLRPTDPPGFASGVASLDASLTADGMVLGTLPYMSPEQVKGRECDARTDLFAFGAVLYEMLTGARAFAADSQAGLIADILDRDPPPLATRQPGMPAALERLVATCLAKNPGDRWQHAHDVSLRLSEIAAGQVEDPRRAVRPRRIRSRRLRAVVASLIVVIVAAAAWVLRPRGTADAAPLRVVQLTTLPGHERWPTFSPDGSQVAFEWNGEKADNADIYIKIVGSTEVRRLTLDPAGDWMPAWSPDGREIAYLRQIDRLQVGRIHLVSPLGGSDRRLSDLAVWAPISWSPDGRHIAAERFVPQGESRAAHAGIYLIPVQGGEPRRIVRTNPPAFDQVPTFSPDGRRLAYVSCARRHACYVNVVEIDAAWVPSAAPRRLTTSPLIFISSLAWTRDGREVVFSCLSTFGVTHLCRIPVEGARAPQRIEVAGLGATMPTVALTRERLAFSREAGDVDVYAFHPGGPARPVVSSTFGDEHARFSPDGRRIAFSSVRSGEAMEIWVANADGSGVQQVTRGMGAAQGSPRWSPDGRQIAFDSFGSDGHWHLWIVDAGGGTPRQITTGAGDEHIPTWSRDGRWIYFAADQATGGRDLYRIPSVGGTPERLTRGTRGRFACESADGRSLLLQPVDADSPLLAMPLAGGPPRQLIACVKAGAFGIGPQGVYYVPCGTSVDPPVHVLDPATGRDRRLGTLEKFHTWARPNGLSVSPDGTILYVRHMSDSADLMLIENFR